ncbi:hypothetical protein TNCV_1452321 [Trichonephila clavipes]|nr:hypothetical protein TNCV_1452321 [Trichonephila clavipes]
MLYAMLFNLHFSDKIIFSLEGRIMSEEITRILHVRMPFNENVCLERHCKKPFTRVVYVPSRRPNIPTFLYEIFPEKLNALAVSLTGGFNTPKLFNILTEIPENNYRGFDCL